MKQRLRFGQRLLLIAGLLTAPGLMAWAQQCPVATICAHPGAASAANAAFGFGIVKVTLGSLTSITAVGDGYQDFSCTRQTNLQAGSSYTLTVQTSPNGPENVRVWLDYNNDGSFTDANELVFSSDNQTVHIGTITVPGGSVLGTPLRLRIAADFANAAQGVPTACATSQYSQTEDYAVVLSANASPPAAAFTLDTPVTCSGCVQFQDHSQNLPVTWSWDFGDGSSSSEQNPRHCYTTPGTYTVRLTATNEAGSGTSSPASVVYDTRVPIAATCVPATTDYCCNYGITNFQLGSISQASADGRAGYEDFSCTQRTELRLDEAYPLSISTAGTLNHATQVYLDLNNDGAFTTNERLYNAPNARDPSTNLLLTAANTPNAVFDQPLRLRVLTDYVGATLSPCGPLLKGQAEDYTVILRPSASPPTVDFSANYGPGSCGNTVQFTDLSKGEPTSWSWEFGDGTTSPLQNPAHTYPSTGAYTVRLTATNNFGPSTLSRAGFLTIQGACLPYCASNGAGAAGGTSSFLWITRVALENAAGTVYSHDSGLEAGGYGNYTAQPMAVLPGASYTLRVVINASLFHRVTAWADYNRDGVFSLNEVVTTGFTQAGPGRDQTIYTATIAIPAALGAGPVRLRVVSMSNNNNPGPCDQNLPNAEVEDYTLQGPKSLATHPGRATLPGLAVFPNPILADGQLHLSLTDASAAGLYALTVENLLGSRLLSTTRRLAPAADATLDLSALPSGIYVLRLRDGQGREALRRVVRD